MRKGGPSDIREATFKASEKGKEKEDLKESGYISEEDDVNFANNLQQGSRRFRGKLPFKCFACGRVGHYAAKCAHKDSNEKGKELVKGNRKQFVNRRSYYTHEDSDGLFNIDEDESGQDFKLLMAYDNDDFMDALEEENFLEEITQLKIFLEEHNMVIDTLTHQLTEREKHNEKLECEVVGLRKELEKTKSLNLRFAKGSKTLDEIIKVQRSPLIKTSLGYTGETSQSKKPLAITRSYLDAAKTSEQCINPQQKLKITPQNLNAGANFGHTIQKEKTSSNSKLWKKKEFSSERCGIALFVEGQENQWYIDSGCFKHMTGDKYKLLPYNDLEKEKNVSFGNDTQVVINGKGFVYLKEKVKDGNFMHVNGLKHNLLSVSQMCDQGNEVVF
eukprot:PITA_26039